MKLADILERIYVVNLDIPEEKFNMESYFKVIKNRGDTECKTTACLIGNALLYDDYFFKNGIFLNSINIVEYDNYLDTEAIGKFLQTSEVFAAILFIPNVSKNVIMSVLQKTILYLKQNENIRLHELLSFLKYEDESFLEAVIKILSGIDQDLEFENDMNVYEFYLQFVDEIARQELNKSNETNFIYEQDFFTIRPNIYNFFAV